VTIALLFTIKDDIDAIIVIICMTLFTLRQFGRVYHMFSYFTVIAIFLDKIRWGGEGGNLPIFIEGGEPFIGIF
jgi:hypothetical protein